MALVACVASACDQGGRPNRLLDGEHASKFGPVGGSVLTQARVVTAATLGSRLDGCRATPPSGGPIVERVGVFGESVTFRNRDGTELYACDGGVDPVGERSAPWCGLAVGELVHGRLLDPRLDILCEDRDGRRLAYAFVVPVAGAHWIGVDQGDYTEVYEVLAGLPVRVATARHVDVDESRATFEITEYDAHGTRLLERDLEARVAG